jgi:hypothetical protein
MPPVNCPKCGKPFKSEGHLAQHMMTHRPEVVDGAGVKVVRGLQNPIHPEDKANPPKPKWATYQPVAAPKPPEAVPQGGGVLVTSGIWEMGVALENTFLERNKAKITPEQSKAMDTNLAAYLGQAGRPISPAWGLFSGVLTIFIAPIVMEFGPMAKEMGKKWWEEWNQQQKEKKEAQRGASRGQLPASGQQPQR